jgi:hypothetical protein
MYSQVYLAQGIVDGRAWSAQDAAALRTAELARPSAGRRILARVNTLLGH